MKPADRELYQCYVAGDSYRLLAQERGLNEDSVRGRIGRVRRELEARCAALEARVDELEREREEAVGVRDLGTPWMLSGDFVIVGDVHVSTTDWAFAQRPLQIAERYLNKPRRLIVAGDLINGEAFSSYEMITPLPPFSDELKAARRFIDSYLAVFDEIYVFLGNHDRRVQKQTNNAISPADLLRLVSHDPRVHISHWGHCVVNTPNGEYRILHGSDYSINQLVVAAQLADKYQQHIISHHQHHLAIGWSKYKQWLVIDNGGLFDESALAYVHLDDNKRPRMANGFTLLLNGTPYVFGKEPFTDWDWWLSAQEARKTA